MAKKPAPKERKRAARSLAPSPKRRKAPAPASPKRRKAPVKAPPKRRPAPAPPKRKAPAKVAKRRPAPAPPKRKAPAKVAKRRPAPAPASPKRRRPAPAPASPKRRRAPAPASPKRRKAPVKAPPKRRRAPAPPKRKAPVKAPSKVKKRAKPVKPKGTRPDWRQVRQWLADVAAEMGGAASDSVFDEGADFEVRFPPKDEPGEALLECEHVMRPTLENLDSYWWISAGAMAGAQEKEFESEGTKATKGGIAMSYPQTAPLYGETFFTGRDIAAKISGTAPIRYEIVRLYWRELGEHPGYR